MTGSLLVLSLLLTQPRATEPVVAWRAFTPPGTVAELAPDGTSFLVGQGPANVECRSPTAEKVRWRYTSPAEVDSPGGTVLPTGDFALVERTEGKLTLVVLRAKDGTVRWRRPLKDGSGGRVVVLDAARVGLQESLDTLLALDVATGAVRWRFTSPSKCPAPSRHGLLSEVRARGGRVLATAHCEDAEAFLHVMLDAATGARRWSLEAPSRLYWPADARLFRADGQASAEIDAASGKTRALVGAVELPPSRGRVELRAFGPDGSRYFFNAGFTNFPGAPSEGASWWVVPPGATKATRLDVPSPPEAADHGSDARYGPVSQVSRVVLLDGGRAAVLFSGELGASGRLGLVRSASGPLSRQQALDALHVAP
jgi:hypothetical protein